MKVLASTQMKEIDRTAIEEIGIKGTIPIAEDMKTM